MLHFITIQYIIANITSINKATINKMKNSSKKLTVVGNAS